MRCIREGLGFPKPELAAKASTKARNKSGLFYPMMTSSENVALGIDYGGILIALSVSMHFEQ